jgi:hypothetical protein
MRGLRLSYVLLVTSLVAIFGAGAIGVVGGSQAAALGDRNMTSTAPAQVAGTDVRARTRWFYQQRQYPYSALPAGALLRAHRQAQQLANTSMSTGVAGAPTSPINWTSFGPRPISSTSQPAIFDGPAPYAGRVTAIAHDQTNPAVAYLGAADGGVWKTTNSGGNWTPTFDDQSSLAIGSIAIDYICRDG